MARKEKSTKRKGRAQKVGRANPAQHTQFGKGISGNPRARPNGGSRQRSDEKRDPKKGERMLSTITGQKVGRGNPPKHMQFRKGVSGNPRGRPGGASRRRS